MTDSVRSFLAFDIDNDIVIHKLASVQQLLVKTGADLKLVKLQNIHITVRFLGNITSIMVDKISEKMKQIQFVPFNLQVKGLGAFPNPNYPRVVWAGITTGVDQLKDVFNQLETHLRGLGFTPNSKGFSPHLTIGRVRSARNKKILTKLLAENADHEFGIIKAKCLRLKKSELTPKGPVYSILKEFCPQE